MDVLLQLMVGFSVGMSVLLMGVLAIGYRQLTLPWQSRLAGFVMLAGLAFTQLGHMAFASGVGGVLPSRWYMLVVFLQSLGFYGLLLGVLRPRGSWRKPEWAIPLAVLGVALVLPLRWAVPVVLAGGAGGALHLCLLVHRLRAVRRWFALELKVMGLFGLMGVATAIIGLLAPSGFGWPAYAWTYSALITLGFLLVGWLLLTVPDLVPRAEEAVGVAYAQSTLARVDRESMTARLRQLFEEEQIHRSESLSLGTIAEMIGLSAHQLSELVNTEFGIGFSRLVRQYRVETAKRMLVDEPRASVLSVGMAAGFSSQSTFYVAFKELVGQVPGEYRRRRKEAAGTSG